MIELVAHNKLSYKQVESLFISKGLKLLTNKYKNNSYKMLCLNSDSYKVLISYMKLKDNRTPTVFGNGNPYTIENIKSYLKNNSISDKLISTEFKTACKNRLIWRCNKGHEFELSWNSFQQGRRCPKCFATVKKTTEWFKEEVFNLVGIEYELSSEYKKDSEHVKMKHTICGHEYPVTPSHFLQGRRCPKCAIKRGKEHATYNSGITDEERTEGRFLYKDKLKEWRVGVFERDNYTCQVCHNRGGITLHAHHSDGYHWCKEKRFEADNGVTLCQDCHRSFHKEYGTRNNTKKQFEEFKNNKYQIQHA